MEICACNNTGGGYDVFSMALAAAVLSSGTLGLKDGWSGAFYVLGWILESSFVSMLTLGLVKGSEMVTQKALGL